MAFDLEQRQTAALQEMLQLKRPQLSLFGARGAADTPGSTRSQHTPKSPWKVLIFDDVAKDILAPLMTVRIYI